MVGQSDHLNEIQSYLLAQRQQAQVSREKRSGAWSPWRAEDSAGVHPVGRSMLVEVHTHEPWGMVYEVWVFASTRDCE